MVKEVKGHFYSEIIGDNKIKRFWTKPNQTSRNKNGDTELKKT